MYIKLITILTISIFSTLGHTKSVSTVSDNSISNDEHGSVIIEISNINQMKGKVHIAVFNDSDTWLNKSVYSVRLPINEDNCKESTCVWKIENVSYDDYGIAAFHDINGNGEMDTNFIGLPQEAYGFSNNETSAFGLPPSWKKAKFNVKTLQTIHTIVIN